MNALRSKTFNLQAWRENWRVIWVAAEMTLRHTAVDAFVIFTVMVQPLLIAVLGLWMLRDKGLDYAMFVVVGSGLTGLWSSTLFIAGNSINVERWSGTLETLVGLPTSLEVIIFGKSIANVVQALLSMVLAYLLAARLFGYTLRIDQPGLFAISLALSAVAFLSFGMILAAIFVLNPGVQQWQNAMEFPVFILCGFMFPIALLPNWTTPLSYLLAPYWAARALHGTSTGGASLQITLFYWGMLLLFSLVDLLIARYLFRRLEIKARQDATLDFN